MTSPTIILVRPQMGENIGAAARAMANFGGKYLRLVAPRDGWPNPKASDTAGRALDVVDDAEVFADVSAAIQDCQFVLATTARARAGNLPVMDVRAAMQALRARIEAGEKCAILFGPERTGLENEDMALANAAVTIPVSETYASLNVGQAVVVVMHEYFQAWAGDAAGSVVPLPLRERLGEGASSGAPTSHPLTQPSPSRGEGFPAPRGDLMGLLDQLEAELDSVNFWRVPEKKDVIWRNIRAMLVRAEMSQQEIATWRGIIRALAEK